MKSRVRTRMHGSVRGRGRNPPPTRFRNGEECTLTKISDDTLHIKNRLGNEILLPKNRPLHLDHNYISTVFSSQGKTCDRVIISVDQTFGREAMYVALSRARHDAKIITPDRDEMMHIVAQSKAKVSALELVPEQKISQALGEGQKHTVQQRMTR